LAITATAANAASLNLRHEYVPESGDMKSAHKDRLLMDHRFANGIGISAEVKWGYNSDGLDFDNMKSGGHETKVSYNYKLTDTFTLQPAYALDSNSTAITHKLDLKGKSFQTIGVWIFVTVTVIKTTQNQALIATTIS